MNQVLRVGDLVVDPGEELAEVVEVPVGTGTVEVPVIAVNGAGPGPRVSVTGGIHGAEYVGIEAARRLGMGLDPENVQGSVVVVPISNTTAYFSRSIYTSGLDNNNLNRMFPGDPEGDPSERLADWLFRTIIEPSDAYIDLHGGDMIEALVPFVAFQSYEDPDKEETAKQMAFATGIPLVTQSVTAGSTYAAATQAGIPAILAEIGGQGVWNDELVEEHRAGAERVLRFLGVLPGPKPDLEARPVRETFGWLRADQSGLFHPSIQIGEWVEEGQPIGVITDYFGGVLQELEAPSTGVVAFLVTSLAMNAGDPIVGVIG